MFGPIQSVIFDFDGTLVDTMPSVIRGLGAAIEFGTGRKIPQDELLASFGSSPYEVLRKWMPEETVPRCLQLWLDFEKSLGAADITPFAEVEAMLQSLMDNNKFIAIFTGRDRAGTLKIARAHGWVGRFFTEEHLACGDDGHPAKPKPDGILKLVEKFALNKDETLMVGDHVYDMMAGRSAGVKTAAALWDLPPGKGTQRSRFREAWTKWDKVDCDLRLASPQSLMGWLGQNKLESP